MRKTLKQLADIRREYIAQNHPYKMYFWTDFDYSILSNILYKKRAGRGDNSSYNDVIIMADTETSKDKHASETSIKHLNNHVVAWSIAIRAFGINICTLWGRKPSDLVNCIDKLTKSMKGYYTVIYWHNMCYDWIFIRKFMFDVYGYPTEQLNTKPLYPVMIKWKDAGIIFKDSLILSQKSIERWAKDMNVEHQKAVGKWDYNKYRTQYEEYDPDELLYIECDVLAGVECIDALRLNLNKEVYSLPYTATGIPREEVRERGKAKGAHERFLQTCNTYEEQLILEQLFHGGYTHANRYIVNDYIRDLVRCLDFTSSYPFTMLAKKFPSGKWTLLEGNYEPSYVLKHMNKYCFTMTLHMIGVELKDSFEPMPVIQWSKCTGTVNVIADNGRILHADQLSIQITELDLDIIVKQYKCSAWVITNLRYCSKSYLPKWLTDYVYECFEAKCKLKNGDPVEYAIAKAKLNSLYGMCVQRPMRNEIIEDYESGDCRTEIKVSEEEYQKYINKKNTVLNYEWGVWVTAWAQHDLYELGECIDDEYYPDATRKYMSHWLYSDTDSIYSDKWDMSKVDAYNEKCKAELLANGYGAVIVDGKEYWLGVATLDGEYEEFVTVGAKRYAKRSAGTHELSITVAGVPKKNGAKVLKDNIENFRQGLIFDGKTTGKLTHYNIFNEKIFVDEDGNEIGDSINLEPCDYLLDSIKDLDSFFTQEIMIQWFEEEI